MTVPVDLRPTGLVYRVSLVHLKFVYLPNVPIAYNFFKLRWNCHDFDGQIKAYIWDNCIILRLPSPPWAPKTGVLSRSQARWMHHGIIKCRQRRCRMILSEWRRVSQDRCVNIRLRSVSIFTVPGSRSYHCANIRGPSNTCIGYRPKPVYEMIQRAWVVSYINVDLSSATAVRVSFARLVHPRVGLSKNGVRHGDFQWNTVVRL